MDRRLAGRLLSAALLAGGCATATGPTPSGPASAVPSPTQVPTVASSAPSPTSRATVTPKPAASQAPGATPTTDPSPTGSLVADTVPAELRGVWRGRVRGVMVDLSLGKGIYRIARGGGTGTGPVETDGDRIVFKGSNLCSGSGTYTWVVAGEELTLTAVAPDGCPSREDALVNTTFLLIARVP